MSSQKTKPIDMWKKGDLPSATKLNQMVGMIRQGRMNIMGRSKAGIRGLPNGSALDIPESFIPSGGILGTIWDAGPGGEANFTNEQYWVWFSYAVASKWGTPVNLDLGYPDTGSDLTNTIVPATNWSERQPGGPAGSGTHVLRVGMPIVLFPVYGRANTPDDVTVVTQFVFYCEDVGYPQYPGQVLVGEAPHTRQWSFITAVPSLT